MPRYPHHASQPNSGNIPTMWSDANRASDLTYSSGTAPHFQHKLDAAHGRWLAGLGCEVQDEEAESAVALNELRLMSEADDVEGNGVFDNPGATAPNIHPDAGVFQTRFNLPGYLARERMFAVSEVRDVTTGRPIVVVPNSPIAFDTNEQVAFIERGAYQPFRPVVNAPSRGDMPDTSIVNVVQNPLPIHGLGDVSASQRTLLLAGGALAAAGALWYLFEKKPSKKGKKR